MIVLEVIKTLTQDLTENHNPAHMIQFVENADTQDPEHPKVNELMQQQCSTRQLKKKKIQKNRVNSAVSWCVFSLGR